MGLALASRGGLARGARRAARFALASRSRTRPGAAPDASGASAEPHGPGRLPYFASADMKLTSACISLGLSFCEKFGGMIPAL